MNIRRLTVTYRGPGDMQLKKREFAPAVKNALQSMLLDVWHPDFLPFHFELAAYSRYKAVAPELFRRRYSRPRKGETAFVRRPLTWTGELKRNVTRVLRVSGTSKRVRGIMPGSQKANFGTHHNMVEELRIVNKTEAKVMAHHVDKRVTEWFNGPSIPRTVIL